MIDKKTGNIVISDAVHIKQNDFQHDILSLAIGQTNMHWDHGNDWTWLQENNVFVNDKYFVFQFGFFQNKLKEIYFNVSETKFELDEGWDRWSEEKELANLKIYQAWLTNELGTQKDFDWGTVWASYDTKVASSSIGLRYK